MVAELLRCTLACGAPTDSIPPPFSRGAAGWVSLLWGAWGQWWQGLVCTCRRSIPAVAPEPDVDEAPVPDLLGSILSGQSLLMMDSADITIHRDGSLSAKRAGKPPPSGSGDTAWVARVGRGCVSHAQKTRRRVGVFSPLV